MGSELDLFIDQTLKVTLAMVIPSFGAFFNRRITRHNIDNWYVHLNFPSYRPPNWVFPVAWVTLYAAMGFASYLVWLEGGGFQFKEVQVACLLYGIHLLLNWSWSYIFFGRHNIKGGLQATFALIVTGIPTAVAFYKVDQLAGALLVPYIAWLIFAAKLNYDILLLNPTPRPSTNQETEKDE